MFAFVKLEDLLHTRSVHVGAGGDQPNSVDFGPLHIFYDTYWLLECKSSRRILHQSKR